MPGQMMGPPQPTPGKWSWDAFKQKGQGLLADPNQLLSNPMFSMGMGLLSENQKPGGGDPFAAAVQGMQSAQGNKQQQEDRLRIEELRKQLQQLIMAQRLPPIQAPNNQKMPPGGGPNIAAQLNAPGIADDERMRLEAMQLQRQGGLLGP